MTAQEQATLETVRSEIQAGFREVRDLMESRRLEEERRFTELQARVVKVETTRSVADAFFEFGKYMLTTIVAVVGVVAIILYHRGG